MNKWVYCFLVYITIRCQDPLTKDLLTYAQLIIQEARRQGGLGWLSYDTIFRQNVAVLNTANWTTLELGLHASIFVSERDGQGLFCTFCSEGDHW